MDKVKIMKRILLNVLSIFFITFYFGSCFDPIFYTVTVETPLLEPLIDGSPTNFVIYNNELYVASGNNIWIYDGSSTWNTKYSLGDRVVSLAATSSSLYALSLDNDKNGKIKNCTSTSNEDLELSEVQSIYAIDNILFASVKNENTYTFHYFDDSLPSNIFKEISYTLPSGKPSSVLLGVAFDNTYYYLCTNSGIYYLNKTQLDSPASTIPDISGFTGIINLNDDNVVAITRNGNIYQINNAVNTTNVANFSDSRYSTGALAIWQDKDDSTKRLLLIGRHEAYSSTTTAYTNGYVEIGLDAAGLIIDTTFNNPGANPSNSSINSYDRYSSSLGKKVINYIFQTPPSIDPNMTLFASTQQDGVWSYRIRDDEWQWNAEQ